MFPKNSGTPKSFSLIGFSSINHPFWGTPIFGNTHIFTKSKSSFSKLNINDTIPQTIRHHPSNNATPPPTSFPWNSSFKRNCFWSFWWFLVSTISPKESTKRLLQQASLSPSMIVLRQPTCPPPRSPRQQQHRWHGYCLRHRWSSTSQGWTSWLVMARTRGVVSCRDENLVRYKVPFHIRLKSAKEIVYKKCQKMPKNLWSEFLSLPKQNKTLHLVTFSKHFKLQKQDIAYPQPLTKNKLAKSHSGGSIGIHYDRP